MPLRVHAGMSFMSGLHVKGLSVLGDSDLLTANVEM